MFVTINSLRRRAKKTDNLLTRFIKGKQSTNRILQAGIDVANEEIEHNTDEILEAQAMQESNSKLL